MTIFSAADLAAAFDELGTIAVGAGKVVDIAVYGGSCLMLVSNFRISSEDVDAVAIEDQAFIDGAAAVIAARHGWPSDWLNDGVRTYLSPLVEAPDGHALHASYPSEREPGLRVYVPTAEYMLAMKLMAMRIDGRGKDLADIVALLRIVGITRKEQVIGFAARFFPEARISAKLRLGIDDLWRAYERSLTRPADEPPRYLGRTGPPDRR